MTVGQAPLSVRVRRAHDPDWLTVWLTSLNQLGPTRVGDGPHPSAKAQVSTTTTDYDQQRPLANWESEIMWATLRRDLA
jgi:hypothetical protein